MIRAIIFDCFGVLIISGRKSFHNDFSLFQTEIDDLEHQADYGMISRKQFDNSLAKLVNLNVDQVEARYWGNNERDEKVFDLANDLKSTGKYKIGMLSNVGRGWIQDFIPTDEQKDLFDHVLLSSDVGMAKPDVMIYELMAKKLGVKPSECVMIDDFQVNVDGATNAGMQGIVFNSIEQAQAELKNLLES